MEKVRRIKSLRELFLKYLTEDSKTKDRRKKEYNQAIFDKVDGFAIFNGTDLGMVIDKFDIALKAYYSK